MAYKPFILALTEGGTNASLTASNGGIIYSTASAFAVLAATSTANQPLLSGASGAPGWSTATYPGSTTINRILYSSANNVVGQITTANSGVLTTDTSGVPTITNTITLVSTGTTLATLESDDAGAGAGPIVDLYRNSASPAASDVIGQIQFNGQNSTPAKKLYGQITGQIDSATASSETSRLTFSTVTGGTLTTQLAMLNTGCQVRGNNTNTTPPAGYLGEQLSVQKTSGSPLTLTSTTPADLGNITLTPGIWNVTLQAGFSGGAITGTQTLAYISVNSASVTGIDPGNNASTMPTVPTAGSDTFICIADLRVAVSSNTTYYGVVRGTFTLGTMTAYGVLRATRVG